MLIKCLIACVIDLMSFRGQTCKNVQDVRKLVFRCASESLYVTVIFMCCLDLRRSVVDPSALIDMLRVKTSRMELLGTMRRTPKEDQILGQEAAQRSEQEQE